MEPRMILGLTVTGPMMLVGGAILLLLTVFQVLVGLRKIKFGRRHRAIHKWTGFAILAIAAVHGLMGIAFAMGFTIL
jgi:hypothetical protein